MSRNCIKLPIGSKYGKLTIINKTENTKSGHAAYSCLCDCGTTKIATAASLNGGQTVSCGCFKRNRLGLSNKTHGMSNTFIYKVWTGIKRRCYNENEEFYHHYGGRGIKMCDEWLNDPQAFIDWALSNGYKHGLWIERIDNDGDYTPINCRWATIKEQSMNRRTNRFFTVRGITASLKEFSIITGIGQATIIHRLKAGWSEEDAIYAPIQQLKKKGIITH